MTIGTLRDQIIYPDSQADMRRKGIKDENINDLLDKVQLTYLVQREGGFDGVQDWMDVLSGGEKQRIAVRKFIKSVIISFRFVLLDGSFILSQTSIRYS